eukprot:759906-Hanusia_phi.AAC.5
MPYHTMPYPTLPYPTLPYPTYLRLCPDSHPSRPAVYPLAPCPLLWPSILMRGRGTYCGV